MDFAHEQFFQPPSINPNLFGRLRLKKQINPTRVFAQFPAFLLVKQHTHAVVVDHVPITHDIFRNTRSFKGVLPVQRGPIVLSADLPFETKQ